MTQHNKIIGVIAPKGSGKTHDVCEYLRVQPRFAAYVIFREDAAYLGVSDQVILESPRQLAEAMKPDAFRLIYHPGIPVPVEGELVFPSFDTFTHVCYERGNCLMVMDEAHLLCDAKRCPPWLLWTLINGRRRGVSIMYVSHRFSTIHRMLTANTDEFWFYRITEPGDLDSIRQRCGHEVMEKVKTLRRLEVRDGTVTPGERLQWSTYGGTEQPEGEPDGGTPTREGIHGQSDT